jgi:hypothetical protein
MTTTQKIGRRYYLRGLPFAAKDEAKRRGAKWDPQERAWWSGKEDVAQAIVDAAQTAQTAARTAERESGISLEAEVVRGRATYKGKTYYVLYEGPTKQGKPCAKLVSRDGSLVFWAADMAQFRLLKTYRAPTSIAALRAYAERRKAEDAGEIECSLCERYCTCGTGRFCTHHHDGCDRCGEER